MTNPRDPRKPPVEADDEVDGLLEGLTAGEYREEQATIPVDPEPLIAMSRPPPPGPDPSAKTAPTAPKATQAATPKAPPRPLPSRPPGAPGTRPPVPTRPPAPSATRPPAPPATKMPRPGAPRMPRPGSDVRTATPPAVNPAGPPRREPFPPAVSPAPGPARVIPRPPSKHLPGPAAFDDAEIDAALMPLSGPPPAMASSSAKTVPPPGVPSSARTTPPPPMTHKSRERATEPPFVEQGAESWRPPMDSSTESLDDLDAVEMAESSSVDDDSLPETRQSAELSISSPEPVPTPRASAGTGPRAGAAPARPEPLGDDAPSVEASLSAVEWEDEPTSILSVSALEERVEATVEYGSASLDDLGVTEADVAEDGEPARPHEAARRSSVPPRASSERPDRDASDRPAAAHLGDHRLIDAWVARAEWFEEEAHASEDGAARARLLLAASELWAMAGNTMRARDAAKSAAQAAPSLGLAARQARAIALLESDFKAVALSLDLESRSAQSDAARAHAAYVASEVYRHSLSDRESAERRLDLVVRTAPGDARPYVLRLAAELGEKGAPSKVKWPDSGELSALSEAAAELSALRGKEVPELSARSPSATFESVRRALSHGDRAAAGRALRGLGNVPGLGDGALFLSAALLAPSAETRAAAIETLVELGRRDSSAAVKRALAARSLEQGDGAAMERALADEEGAAVFTGADRAALGALSGSDAATLAKAAAELADDETLRPLAAAVAATAGSSGVPLGDPATRALLALGRALATAASADALKDAVHAVRASAPTAALGRILALELDAAAGATSAVAAELARLAPKDRPSDGKLAAALIEEGAGHAEIARRQYAAALGSADVAEAAARALLRPGEGSAPDLLSTLASALGDETTSRQALLLYEAAMLADPDDAGAVEELLNRSHEASPELPFAARRGSELARARGDAAKLLEWIGKERAAAREPIARALVAIREALLIADDDPVTAASRVDEALLVRPVDAALHELKERLDRTPSPERGKIREHLARQTDLPRTKAWLLSEATREYERAGDTEGSVRAAQAMRETDGGALSKVLAERVTPSLPEPALEGLSALRAREQELLGTDREEELEKLSTELVELPDRGESSAHARLAARLAVKRSTWESARAVVERAARHTPQTLWTLRQASAHARVAGDDARLLASDQALLERIPRPLDKAVLSLRAAEAAARLGRADEALALLDATLETTPDHVVARDLRSRLREQGANAAGAAEDLEALARAARVPDHQFAAWYRAGVLFQDGVSDTARGVAALEEAAAIDITREDVFDRLQLLYVQRGDRGKLASLLERRLEKTTDPEERIALEVTRGRALADVGDREAARRALSAALEASPDHADALEAFATLCAGDGDYPSAEQAWIRLARLATDPEKQAEIYGKLATLYGEALPNPQRAEICYREILKRRPNDPHATESLVGVYVRLSDPVKAIELQNGLVERAATPEEKRDRTIALSLVYDEAGKDKKAAFAVLEKARKAWPHDSAVLRALALHHGRHGEGAAASVLLDRAAAEARRALAHGRFDLAFFGMLQAAAELRGQADAALVAKATVAALEGRDDAEVQGAGAAASRPDLDDLLAPDLLSAALRALLHKLPGVLDTAYPVDLKALRATPAPASELVAEMRVVAESLGIRGLELLVSPALGPVFLPASSAPPKLVLGQAMLDGTDDAARYFSLFRALKMMQANAAAFTRIPPIELLPAASALLAALAPSYQPQGVDAAKLADAKRRIASALPARLDDDLPTLALEVSGAIGNRASQLGQAVGQWASRAALLAVGSPSIALRGVALALGQESPPSDVAERLKWVVRQGEARDLATFTVSEGYAEARKRVGLG